MYTYCNISMSALHLLKPCTCNLMYTVYVCLYICVYIYVCVCVRAVIPVHMCRCASDFLAYRFTDYSQPALYRPYLDVP